MHTKCCAISVRASSCISPIPCIPSLFFCSSYIFFGLSLECYIFLKYECCGEHRMLIVIIFYTILYGFNIRNSITLLIGMYVLSNQTKHRIFIVPAVLIPIRVICVIKTGTHLIEIQIR